MDELISRDELFSGRLNLDRRAAKLLTAIEARCVFMRDQSRGIVEAYLLRPRQEYTRRFDVDYLQNLKLQVAADEPLALDHLERFAAQWEPVVPPDAELRAATIELLAQKYSPTAAACPRTLEALGAGRRDVQAAYRCLYGKTLRSTLRASRLTASGRPGRARAGRAEIETRLQWLTVCGGEALYRAGDAGDALYILISGRLRLVTEDENGEHSVDELGRGEMVGEMEVLAGEPRSTTAYAVRDSEVVKLARADLLGLAALHPQVLVQLNRVVGRHLREHYAEHKRAGNTLLTFTLVPAGRDMPLGEFGRQLAQALQGFGPTFYVTRSCLEDALGPGAADVGPEDERNAQIVAWLNELEASYRYVVYEAEAAASEWSLRCVRQADRVLVVGRVGSTTVPAAYETALLEAARLGDGVGRAGRVELVLWQDAGGSRRFQAHSWLAGRGSPRHYHVRAADLADVACVARRLTGRALGLVLGGGGARGWAHAGVLRALAEAGIEVDLVGGTSMGAIVGALYAMGIDHHGMRELARRMSSPVKLFDPTIPVVSFLASSKVTGILQKLYGTTLIEDLWRPFFCMSSNLTHAVPVVHDHGSLWQAVRASSAMPGIFSPVLLDGDLLVDGCVLNNLPVDVMDGLTQGGPIVAVNVFPEVDMIKDYRFGPSVSGWQALFDKLNPFVRDTEAPSIFESLLRVLALNDVHQAKAKRPLVDLHISPPVDRFNILDFGAYEEIAEVGYLSAQKAIAGWQERPCPAPAQASRPAAQLQRAIAELESAIERLQR